LESTARWFTDLGTVDPATATGLGDTDPWMVTTGTHRHLAPVAQLAGTPGRWDRPAPPLGADPPTWAS
jgi:hypothetical protein